MKKLVSAFVAAIAAVTQAQTVYTVETSAGYSMETPAKLENSTVTVSADGVVSTVPFGEVEFAAGSVLRKTGAGFLESTTALGSFTGEIRVEEGGIVLTDDGQLGPSSADTAPSLVISSGAMLVINNTNVDKAAEWKYYNPITVGGFGIDGMGAIRNISTVSARNVLAGKITLSGDALFYGAGTYWGGVYDLTVDFQGHTLVFDGVSGPANNFALNRPKLVNPGNMELRSTGAMMLMQQFNEDCWEGGAANLVRIKSGSRLGGYNAGYIDSPWTIVAENDTVISFNNDPITYDRFNLRFNAWRGPVLLDGLLTIQHGNSKVVNTFRGTVSGTEETELRIARGYLNLMNPDNDFEGKLVIRPEPDLEHSAPPGVNLWANGAIPETNTNGISVMDGNLSVKASERVSLPRVEYAVSEGTNMVFEGVTAGQVASLKKTGAGTLDFTAPFTVTGRTELLEGTMRIAPFPDVYSVRPGLTERYYVVPEEDRVEATVKNNYEPVWYHDTTAWDTADPADIVTCVTNFPALGEENYGRWKQYMFARYDGYIWNRTDDDVTYSFALSFCKAAKIIIDGNVVASQSSWKTLGKGDVTLSPGPHAFTALFCANAYGNMGARVAELLPDGSKLMDVIGKNWNANFGCVYDPLGRASNTPDDYMIPANGVSPLSPGGDGALFTLDDKKMEDTDPAALAGLRAHFSNLVCRAGTVLDLNDPGKCFVVPSLEGFTSVTNGDLMISGDWTVDREGIEGGGKLYVDGKLFFADGAKIVIGGDSPLRGGTYVLAETTGGISGLPKQGAADGAWLTFSVDTADGVTRLRMTCSRGLSVVIR